MLQFIITNKFNENNQKEKISGFFAPKRLFIESNGFSDE